MVAEATEGAATMTPDGYGGDDNGGDRRDPGYERGIGGSRDGGAYSGRYGFAGNGWGDGREGHRGDGNSGDES